MKKISIFFVIVLLTSCASTENRIKKTTDGKDIHQLIESNSFEVVLNFASPSGVIGVNAIAALGLLPVGSSANNINLSNTSSTFIKNDDRIEVLLPYYGEQRMSRGYSNSRGGIQFNGVPQEYTQKYDDDKNLYEIEFKMKEGTESYKVIVRLYKNLSAKVYVYSSHRTSISYSGFLRELPDSYDI